MNNSVTVISIYHNREDDVVESVGSLIAQLDTVERIIIVDDGSTDSTLERLLDFRNHKKVDVVSQNNMGFTRALIKAMSTVKSDFVAIHGSGDISHPNRFAKQAKILSEQKEVSVVGCCSKTIYADSSRNDEVSGREFMGDAKKLMSHGNIFSHGEVMFRVKDYNLVGGYRSFFKFAQDKDLWCRMSCVGDFVKMPDVLYTKYKNRSDGVSGNQKKLYEQQMLSCFAEFLHIESGFDYSKNNVSSLSALEFRLSFKQKLRLIGIGLRVEISGNTNSNLFLDAFPSVIDELIKVTMLLAIHLKDKLRNGIKTR
ncbi:glycosyltransferase family 2 protein [Vibrio astriarenae]